MNLKERAESGKIRLAGGGNREERRCLDLLLIPRVMGYPPIRSLKNVSKIMGALQVLSVPPGYRFKTNNGRREIHYSILVPSGEVSSWGPRSQASVPLSDESVKELERAHGRICVIAPNSADTPKAKYIFDRVRAVLRRNNIPFEESEPHMKEG